MPSLLDHLATGDGADPSTVSPPAGLIDAVKADGSRRRVNRRRRNLALAVLCLGLLAVPAATLGGGNSDREGEINVAADGDGTETTFVLEPVESTVVAEVPLTPPATTVDTAPPVTEAPATSVAPPTAVPTTPPSTRAPGTTPTTAPACRNSDKPSCGDFRWDPPPGPNQPLVGSFVNPPATAQVGVPVVFEVTWSDPDAKLTSDRLSPDGSRIISACTLPPRFGPWTPPPAVGGSGTLRYTHTFQTAGTYSDVTVELGTADCTSPYGNDAQVPPITITVS